MSEQGKKIIDLLREANDHVKEMNQHDPYHCEKLMMQLDDINEKIIESQLRNPQDPDKETKERMSELIRRLENIQ